MRDSLACRAHISLETLLRIGVISRLLPYEWDANERRLKPGTTWNLRAFNFHKNLTLIHTSFLWFRLIQAGISGEFSLLAALWALADTTCSAGFVTLSFYTNDVMHFTNRLLHQQLFSGNNNRKSLNTTTANMTQIELRSWRSLTFHMSFNMFLLYANPVIHIYPVYQNPCAPNFLSSLIFECQSSLDDPVGLTEKSFFLIFEFYTISKWQYIVSFNWVCIYFGMSFVDMELKKLWSVRLAKVSNIRESMSFHRDLKKCDLTIKILNDTFWYYMSVFPLEETFVVSLLLYGTVRVWRLGPEAVMMYPLCAVRCGFEAFTPLSLAGSMSQESVQVLEKWRRSLGTGEKRRVEMRTIRFMQRDCRKLECKCGAFFSFGKVILLEAVNICIDETVNLLATF